MEGLGHNYCMFQSIGSLIMWYISNTCGHSVIQMLSYLKNLSLERKIIKVIFLISGLEILK